MPTHQPLPEQFGRYHIERQLGQGGMGAVYLALDTRLGRRVALKVPHFTAADGTAVIERFRREARVAASLDHPNLCAVYDVDEVGGVHFFTMPFIEGTLLSLLIEQPWPPRRAAELVRQVALALSLLHRNGIVHRDLKPGNVMMRSTGEPVLMDFGLARSYAAQSRRLTAEGAALGTPAYMSPEQVEGDPKKIGPATDVYSLGVILYELLTGQVPFEGPPLAVFAQVLNAGPRAPAEVCPELDAAIDGICRKAMAKKPDERYADMNAFGAALVEYARRSEPAAAPVGGTADRSGPEALTLSADPDQAVAPPSGSDRSAPDLLGTDGAPELLPRPAGDAIPPRDHPHAPRGRLGLLAAGVLVGALLAVGATTWLMLRNGEASPPKGAPPPPVISKGAAERVLAEDGPPKRPPPQPVISLRLLKMDSVTVAAGESRTIKVRLQRPNCPGPVELRLAEPVEGVTLRNGLVPADRDEGSFDVVAAADAKRGERILRVRASAALAEATGELRLTIQAAGLAKTTTNMLGMRLALIRKGRFKMGSPPGEVGREADEGPQRVVEITRDFYKAATEVTVGQFKQFVTATGHKTKAEVEGSGLGYPANQSKLEEGKFTWRNPGYKQADDHPVVLVSWNDAVEFCEWLSRVDGQTYELPTEAEWEYAARAGTTTAYHSGDDPETLARVGNVADASARARFPGWTTIKGNDGYVFTAPVAKFRPNAFGLYDMHGNVWEWCQDWYDEDSYKNSSIKDPQGPKNGPLQVVRGGAWDDTPLNSRLANRSHAPLGYRSSYIGFRVVLRVGP